MIVPAFALPLLAAGAAPTPNNQPGGQGQEFGSSGPVALVVIIALLIATGFLIRSMSKHIKRIPPTFDKEEAAQLEADAAATDADRPVPAHDTTEPEKRDH